MVKKTYATLIAILLLVTPMYIHAHGIGVTLEAVEGDYTIDLDYDDTAYPVSAPTAFNFKLYNHKTIEAVLFSDVAFTIKQKEHTLLSTTITRGPLGATTLAYKFPRGGTYTVQATYQQTGQRLAQGTFDIVIPETQIGIISELSNYKKYFAVAFILIGVAGLAYLARSMWRERKNRND